MYNILMVFLSIPSVRIFSGKDINTFLRVFFFMAHNTITITFLPSGKRVKVEKGIDILSAAQKAKEGIRSLCGGKGACGKCIVLVNNGVTEKSEELQKRFLSKERREKGFVIACRTKALSDLEVFIPPETRLEKQQILSDFVVTRNDLFPLVRKEFVSNSFLPEIIASRNYNLSCSPDVEEGDFTLVLRGKDVIAVEEGNTSDKLYGLAVDIGTTSIVAALVDLNTGRILNITSDYNGQIIYGEEILSRVELSRKKDDGVSLLKEAVIGSLNRIIHELLNEYVSPEMIYDVVTAGNTIMSHFFHGKSVDYLFSQKKPGENSSKENLKTLQSNLNRAPLVTPAYELGLNVNKNAMVYSLPSVGKFLGGDVIGDIISSNMINSMEISLLIDLGTNGEIVIGSEGWAISTSVASGPAFEGYEIKYGSRAVEGAIDHVIIEGYDAKPRINVIGNVKPKSICGSGLIDLLAELFKNGIVDFTGKLDKSNPRVRNDQQMEYVVVEKDESAIGQEITLSQKDIETLLESKAAVCAGISVLLKKLAFSIQDIEKVYIAGGFGYYINVENATTIGLFPEFPNGEVIQIGNGSLSGSYLALTSVKKRQMVETVAKLVSYIDLSTDPEFFEEYNGALVLPGKEELFPTIYTRYI
jgi:uncharacterized 2Fe-2S/4Fe-4S cluster protein (DUF4445 family)